MAGKIRDANICAKLGFPLKILPQYMDLKKHCLLVRVWAINQAGLRPLFDGGYGKNLLGIREPGEFFLRIDSAARARDKLSSALKIFGFRPDEQHEIILSAFSSVPLIEKYADNLLLTAQTFEKMGFEQPSQVRFRKLLCKVFDRSKRYSIVEFSEEIIFQAIREGRLGRITCSFDGFKRRVLRELSGSAGKYYDALVLDEEQLRGRHQRLGELFIIVNGQKIFPWRLGECRMQNIAGKSEEWLLAQAEHFARSYKISQEVFDANSKIFDKGPQKSTLASTAFMFFKAAVREAGAGRFEKAKELIDLAKEKMPKDKFPSMNQGISSFDEAITAFLQARAAEGFENRREILRRAYRACLKCKNNQGKVNESSACAPLAHHIKVELGRLYQAEYVRLEASLKQKLSQRLRLVKNETDQEKRAKLLIAACKLARPWQEAVLRLKMVNGLSCRLKDKDLLSYIILYFMEKEERIAVGGEIGKKLNELGTGVISELDVDLNKDYLVGLSPIKKALGLLLFSIADEPVVLVKVRKAWYANCQHLAEKLAAAALDAEVIKLMKEICRERDIPLSSREERIITNNGLASSALSYLLGNQDPSWQEFFLSLAGKISPELAGICEKYKIPCFLLEGKTIKDAGRLLERIKLLDEEGLLFIFQAGVGRVLFRGELDSAEFSEKVKDLKEKAEKFTKALILLHLEDEEIKEILVQVFSRHLLRKRTVNGYLIAAKLFQAMRLPAKQKPAVVDKFIDMIKTGGEVELFCQWMLAEIKDRVDQIYKVFDGDKKEAIKHHEKNIFDLVKIALMDEEEVSECIKFYQEIKISIGGKDYFPLKARKAALEALATDSLPGLVTRIEWLIGHYGFTEKMFEINYKMAGNGYFMAELTPMVAAIAFMRTSMVCFEENNLQDALWYAGKAQRMALEDKREKVEQLVNAHFDAISLFQEAAHLWENREEIPKIVELLRQARLLCKNSRMRKPLAKKVSLLLDKAMKQGESRVIFNKTFSTELLDRFIQKTKEGAFEAVFLMCESEGILTNFASYMLLGSSALRAGEDKKAVDYLRRAATEATNEDRFDFLSHEQRAELCKIATLWLETARATLFIKERKFKSAYFILDAMGKNGLAQLGIREILKGFDENEEGSLLVCQIRDLRNKEKVAAAAAKALAYLEAA